MRFLPFIFLFISNLIFSQTISEKLKTAITKFEADPQMKHAIMALTVVETNTGKTIFDHHGQIGLAPASTQKLFTSAAAFDLLGKDFRYKTDLGYTGTINNGKLKGNLFLRGSGDPSLGSWRWKETRDSVIMKKWVEQVKKAGIKEVNGSITYDWSRFSYQSIPDGWIWQDIGNYYGAGSYALNWRENQFDIVLQSSNSIGSKVSVLKPEREHVNELTAAAKGTGDNAYVYLSHGERLTSFAGTIPVNEKKFTIAGADEDPINTLLLDLAWYLNGYQVHIEPIERHYSKSIEPGEKIKDSITIIGTHLSPPLDSLNYYFLRRSINLYGEALVKTIAYEKTGFGSTEKGVELLKDFWAEKGIEKAALHIMDGSGLSPQNRVTTDALVKVLQYAKSRPWFSSFYHGLPEYNGMKLKSGSIGGARSFAGYHTAKNGKQYSVAVMVNNYDGSSAEVVKKIYTVLNELK